MSEGKKDDDSSSDESFDLTSTKFDAARALYNRNKVKIPVPNAVTLDNLAKYATVSKIMKGDAVSIFLFM